MMHQKTFNRSQVFSALKFGLCFLKYSLVSLTRWESQLSASRQLAVSTLYRGITCHHLELRGSVWFAWGVALPGGKTSTGSGEGCRCLDLSKGSGAGEEGAMGVDTCSGQEAPCEGLNGRDIGNCPINIW